MKKAITALLLSVATNTCSYNTAMAWGAYGHQHITRGAIFALPPQPGIFFYNHADFLTVEAVVPDLRRALLDEKNEPYRHYIDLEGYNYTTAVQMPQTMKEAIARFGNDTLNKYGILPWYIQELMSKLTDAFREKDRNKILFLAGELSHYVGDAHMPLHTLLNYNGQLTNQKGIHAFWESQIPDLFGDTYNLHVDEAHYIKDIAAATWAIIAHSHKLADTVLIKDRELKEKNPDIVYKKDASGKIVYNRYHEPVHSYEYAKLYQQALNGMVEKQMHASEQAVADYWYTAWVNAGKPDLSKLDAPLIQQRNKPFYKEDMQTVKKTGKIPGLKTITEYDK